MEKKKVSVLVAGQRFNIITEEEERYVIDLASRIDARIHSISISQDMNRERAAVLTALDLADDCEQNRRELNEIKEQVKDYLTRIEALSEERDRLKTELSKAQLSVSALDDARKTLAASDQEKESLKRQIIALKEQIAVMQSTSCAPAPTPQDAPEEKPEPVTEEAPVNEPAEEATEAPSGQPAQPQITAEDDLFFDVPQEEAVKPPRKEKKNRHDHSHVNPYKQQHMQKQGEKKGYTQQRQYSLFDTDE